MVSELAGEGAPQLPTPASHVELRYRRRDEQIRRGVNLVKTVTLFTPSTVFGALSLDGNSRSRSVEILSRVLVSHLFAGFNRTSWSRSMRNWSRELVDFLFVAFISWSKSVESMSAELINRSLMAIVVPSSLVLEQWRSWSRSMKISSRVLVNPLFIAFECRSWSRSVEIDDSSSEEIEDKAENDDDGEELTAVNKIRRRRFVFDDEEEQEEDNDEIDVVAAGMSTHIQKLSSAQMKLDLDVLSSSFVVSRASSASLGFSFTGFSKTFSDERADSKAFSDDDENSAVVSRLQSVNFDVVFSTQLSNDCFNSNCKEVSEWARKGCRRRTGEFADLCDPCASAYKETKFCETFHLNAYGWRSCEFCGKQIHCGCIVSFHTFVMLNAGGIECITNAQSDFLPLQPEGIKNSRSWTSCLFNGSVIQTKLQPQTPYGDITGCIDRPHLNERPPVSSLENKRKEEKFGNLLNRSLKSCVLGRLENEHIGFSCSEQTSEHALLAFTLGVRQIICCCNMMGVTANTLRLEDPVENIGAKLVRQVAAKTNGLVGDVLWEMFNDTCKRMRIMKSSLLIEQEKPNERIANYQVLLSLTDCTLSSQVLTVNQVEKILKFLELRDWKASFFEVIPQRKRCEADSEDVHNELEGEENTQEQGDDCQDMKSQCIEGKQLSWCSVSLTFHLKLGIQRFACSAYRGVLEDSTPSVEKNVKGVKVIT